MDITSMIIIFHSFSIVHMLIPIGLLNSGISKYSAIANKSWSDITGTLIRVTIMKTYNSYLMSTF